MSSWVPLRPVLAALSEGRSFKPLAKEYVVEPQSGFQRSHDRYLGELPPLFFTLNPHPNHTGSAFFAIGETRVSAAVSGPYPRILTSNKSGANTNKAPKDGITITAGARSDATIELSIQLAPFALGDVAKTKGQATSLGAFLSECLEGQTLEAEKTASDSQALRSLAESVLETLRSTVRINNYPNTTIEISALVLSFDGGPLFPAVVNAISLALMDAGITVSDVLAACVSYVVKLPGSEPYCCLALDGEELQRIKRCKGELTSVTLALLTCRGLIAFIDMTGNHLKPPFDQQAIALAESACIAIAKEMGNCITSGPG
eukprot:Gregarina_sp_Poly_1__593@NODE_113_length_13886_cov_267_363051_g100_i0_p6_GENE_NODE_113_length_13886_cov_267_363051_g100_i0NODE_113_length_13886_cov_267_363051_g100_i0_p6_ORF_typecomplete_len317_score30_98RNase_PH/PF01138_21/4e19_NODE_113_length_13886_cov_267_363051_g100_i047305680